MKALWQNEKYLIMSNFFFLHNVFKSRLLQTHRILEGYGQSLKHYAGQIRPKQKHRKRETGAHSDKLARPRTLI